MTRLVVTAVLAVALSACKDDRIQHVENGQRYGGEIDAASGGEADGASGGDCDDPGHFIDAGQGDFADASSFAPTLGCEPTATGAARCSCMAAIVCDQIHFCLAGTALDAFPSFSPYDTCVAALFDDCVEDLGDPSLEPADYPACLTALEASTCADFGDFACVGADYPAACANLRALDTGLGVLEACD